VGAGVSDDARGRRLLGAREARCKGEEGQGGQSGREGGGEDGRRRQWNRSDDDDDGEVTSGREAQPTENVNEGRRKEVETPCCCCSPWNEPNVAKRRRRKDKDCAAGHIN